MDTAISEQVRFIKNVKQKYGLSVDQICDIVSHKGGFVSVHTVRRLLAPEAEHKRFRSDTVTPVYDVLFALYGDGGFPSPTYVYPHFDRAQYEQLIAVLKDNNDRLTAQTAEQSLLIEQQRKLIEILWHGLQTFGESSEEYAKIIDYYIKNRKE